MDQDPDDHVQCGVDPEELRHFQEVLCSFCEYGVCMAYEGTRRVHAVREIPVTDRTLLPVDSLLNADAAAFFAAAKRNAEFFARVAVGQGIFDPEVISSQTFAPLMDARNVLNREPGGAAAGHGLGSALPGVPSGESPYVVDFGRRLVTSPHNQRKVHQTLHSVAREWSDEGAAEREECFTPLIQELRRRLPLGAGERFRHRVLLPGAGLGRLVAEVVSAGYRAQGNEFCYQMLLTSEYILNGLGDTTWELHPWADSCTNEVRRGDNVRGVRVPDIAPQELLDFDESAGHGLADDDSNVIPPFSMTAGEFMEVYEDRVAFWDSVVTCFFIDTAPRITEYIRALYRMIKPGGYWINLGPLLWHWAPSLPGNPAHSVGSQLDRRWGKVHAPRATEPNPNPKTHAP